MINLSVPETDAQLSPRIMVIGVGGAGGNAVNNMIRANLEGVEFLVSNTDAQALAGSLSQRKLQLGVGITQGLGAGARPEIGQRAAEDAIDQIVEQLEGSHMVFITAGMGGGTGTGAAPVIARVARELDMLTVGVVTRPFHFEGAHRMRVAEAGLKELQQYVDTLIVIPNQNLFRIANEKTTFADAFKMADDVLHSGVRGVTDLMVMPGLINLDFADIRSVMGEMGKAMMGTGEADGERRATSAAEAAISNPLLDDVSMKGARGVLINITGGPDMTLYEVDEAANRIRDEVDPEANIIFGSTFEETMEGKIRVSVVATGIDLELDADERPTSPTLVVNNRGRAAGAAGTEAAITAADQSIPVTAERQQPVQADDTPTAPQTAVPAAPQAAAPAVAQARHVDHRDGVVGQPVAQRAARTEPAGRSGIFGLGGFGAAGRDDRSIFQRVTQAASLKREERAPEPTRPPVRETVPGHQRPAAQAPSAPAAHAPAAPAAPAPAAQVPAPQAPVAQAPAAPETTPPRQEAQPRLSGVDLANRPPLPPHTDDEALNIPAFLRRQAN